MKCLLCGTNDVRKKFLIGNFQLHKCRHCNCEFIYPQPNEEELQQIYQKEYYNAWGINDERGQESAANMKKLSAKNALTFISNYKKKGNILDVGCALGYFLEEAKQNEFIPFGVELSEYGANISKHKFGNTSIFNGKLEDAKFRNGMFQVITMFDLIEHTLNPEDVLNKALAMLDTDGIICMTTPNVSAFLHWMMGRKWLHYKAEHLFYFNEKGMKIIADKLSCEIISISSYKKVFLLDYVIHQFKTYPHPVFTPVARFLDLVLTSKIKKSPFRFGIGELMIMLRKK